MSTDNRDVLITGVGVVVPGARDLSELSPDHFRDRVMARPIDRFDTTGHTSSTAAVVDDAELASVPRRLRKRVDRFCALSLVAVDRALGAAGLVSNDGTLSSAVDRDRAGVIFGNMFGGWEMTEDSLRRLCQVGYTGVSPYIAAGWFPTASQGQVSIRWGLRGFSKTVVADTASGATAVGTAADAIRSGRADLVIAGAAEAPVTPYTWTFCTTTGRLSPTTYRPFTASADGFTAGEGSVVFVLESAANAQARGATPLAKFGGFASTHAHSKAPFAEPAATTWSAFTALQRAGVHAGEVDYVGLDAQGQTGADQAELHGLDTILGSNSDAVGRHTIKPHTGHLLGAAAAVELGAAVHAIQRGASQTALVHARGAEGTVTSSVLTAA
ncbi:hypothetical protein HJ588_04360 [Flexivirga sp. ID2601S]|uniref:Ketosynthase family 3 (KS3) domain-containing protein n=1 Tax=Flexivirga aerilata TaxID=1656889 RepID=A0A849AH23_9MICO|nr:beta-ketoacyl synthase N-terminal-like domain-containing protein [Flexivirga aerilata]NNG38508.1 hypothetical protein [Flexivirga aerilata]